jgi:hypothetical protein
MVRNCVSKLCTQNPLSPNINAFSNSYSFGITLALSLLREIEHAGFFQQAETGKGKGKKAR